MQKGQLARGRFRAVAGAKKGAGNFIEKKMLYRFFNATVL